VGNFPLVFATEKQLFLPDHPVYVY